MNCLLCSNPCYFLHFAFGSSHPSKKLNTVFLRRPGKSLSESPFFICSSKRLIIQVNLRYWSQRTTAAQHQPAPSRIRGDPSDTGIHITHLLRKPFAFSKPRAAVYMKQDPLVPSRRFSTQCQ